MVIVYMHTICRLVLLMVFLLSLMGKLRNPQQFVATIRNFDLVPAALAPACAIVFMVTELVIVIFLLTNRLIMAYTLSLSALVIFSVALWTVLQRGLDVPCNCFGTSDDAVTPAELIRNGLYISVALLGLSLTQGNRI